MTTNLTIAVVGTGYWGSKHVRVFSGIPGVDVIVVDADQQRAQSVADLHRTIGIAADLADVIHQVDAVVVAVPPAAHFAVACIALDAGKHVMVEKPLATTEAECLELIRRAEDRGCQLMTGHTFLFNDAVLALGEIVRSDDFGDIRHIDSARLNLGIHQRDVNVLWDLAPHDISICDFLVGAAPIEVAAWGRKEGNEPEESAHLLLRYQNGVTAALHASWLDPVRVRRTTVVGTKQMAVYDDAAEERIRIYDRRAERIGKGVQYHWGDSVTPHLNFEEPLRAQADHFLDCIRTGVTPRSDGRRGLEVVKVLRAADEALLSGSFVPLSRYDPDAELAETHGTFRLVLTTDDINLIQPLIQHFTGNGYEPVEVRPPDKVALRNHQGQSIEFVTTSSPDGTEIVLSACSITTDDLRRAVVDVLVHQGLSASAEGESITFTSSAGILQAIASGPSFSSTLSSSEQ